MQSFLLTELLFPAISTVIGALVGGLFAYKIAKERFASDYINEGKLGISIVSDSAKRIKDTGNELYIILINRPGRSTTEFLSLLIDKNNVLEDYLNIFTSDWKNYREKILSCTFPYICKDPDKRKNFCEISETIKKTYIIIGEYQDLIKDCYKEIKREDTGEFTAKTISFMGTLDAQIKLSSAKAQLQQLVEKCELICNEQMLTDENETRRTS